ncbi:hypothetical protein TNCV_3681 [Trichonephila clavipes]|nr:hypothetical protein TNCV_3681 [Trichonephila clavipes]
MRSVNCPEKKCLLSFFFHEQTITGATFLDILTLWLMLQLQDDIDSVVLQLDGEPPTNQPACEIILINISLINGLNESRNTTCHLPNGHPVVLT